MIASVIGEPCFARSAAPFCSPNTISICPFTNVYSGCTIKPLCFCGYKIGTTGRYNLKSEVHHGKTLPPEREPHRCQDRSHGRYHDLYDDGLHPCGQPQHSVCGRYGRQGGADCHLTGILPRHDAHGIPGQLSVCAGPRHGPERLLCLHRRADDGLLLADGPAGRLC